MHFGIACEYKLPSPQQVSSNNNNKATNYYPHNHNNHGIKRNSNNGENSVIKKPRILEFCGPLNFEDIGTPYESPNGTIIPNKTTEEKMIYINKFLTIITPHGLSEYERDIEKLWMIYILKGCKKKINGVYQVVDLYLKIMTKERYEEMKDLIHKKFPIREEYEDETYIGTMEYTKDAMVVIKAREFRGHYEVVPLLRLSCRILSNFKTEALKYGNFKIDSKQKINIQPDEVNARIQFGLLTEIHEPIQFGYGISKSDLLYNSNHIYEAIVEKNNNILQLNYNAIEKYKNIINEQNESKKIYGVLREQLKRQ